MSCCRRSENCCGAVSIVVLIVDQEYKLMVEVAGELSDLFQGLV